MNLRPPCAGGQGAGFGGGVTVAGGAWRRFDERKLGRPGLRLDRGLFPLDGVLDFDLEGAQIPGRTTGPQSRGGQEPGEQEPRIFAQSRAGGRQVILVASGPAGSRVSDPRWFRRPGASPGSRGSRRIESSRRAPPGRFRRPPNRVTCARYLGRAQTDRPLRPRRAATTSR